MSIKMLNALSNDGGIFCGPIIHNYISNICSAVYIYIYDVGTYLHKLWYTVCANYGYLMSKSMTTKYILIETFKSR